MAALRKTKDDDDAPQPPLAPSAPTSESGNPTMKLKRSNLHGLVSWEQMLEKLDVNGKAAYDTCVATLTKMLNNVLANPSEPKYRKINKENPNFVAKVFSCTGAPECFTLCGFKDTIEKGFLVLPEQADLAPLQRALDSLAANMAARQEREEKKRKADAEAAARARKERADKARAASEPAAYDEAVAGASGAMADEDEVMIDAVSAHFEAHPQLATAAGAAAFDAFEIERQVAGPGGSVVASVVASAGTKYVDFLATMRRSEDGAWSVSKVVPAEGA